MFCCNIHIITSISSVIMVSSIPSIQSLVGIKETKKTPQQPLLNRYALTTLKNSITKMKNRNPQGTIIKACGPPYRRTIARRINGRQETKRLWKTTWIDMNERRWRACKNLPQYKYIARPVYKFVARQTNNVIGTIASFFVTDLIMHQLLASIIKAYMDSSPWSFSWSPAISLAWVSLSIPVLYAKYTTPRRVDLIG